jgi:hypothetical protein
MPFGIPEYIKRYCRYSWDLWIVPMKVSIDSKRKSVLPSYGCRGGFAFEVERRISISRSCGRRCHTLISSGKSSFRGPNRSYDVFICIQDDDLRSLVPIRPQRTAPTRRILLIPKANRTRLVASSTPHHLFLLSIRVKGGSAVSNC